MFGGNTCRKDESLIFSRPPRAGLTIFFPDLQVARALCAARRKPRGLVGFSICVGRCFPQLFSAVASSTSRFLACYFRDLRPPSKSSRPLGGQVSCKGKACQPNPQRVAGCRVRGLWIKVCGLRILDCGLHGCSKILQKLSIHNL